MQGTTGDNGDSPLVLVTLVVISWSRDYQTFLTFFKIRNSKRTEMENQEKDNVTVDAAE